MKTVMPRIWDRNRVAHIMAQQAAYARRAADMAPAVPLTCHAATDRSLKLLLQHLQDVLNGFEYPPSVPRSRKRSWENSRDEASERETTFV